MSREIEKVKKLEKLEKLAPYTTGGGDLSLE